MLFKKTICFFCFLDSLKIPVFGTFRRKTVFGLRKNHLLFGKTICFFCFFRKTICFFCFFRKTICFFCFFRCFLLWPSALTSGLRPLPAGGLILGLVPLHVPPDVAEHGFCLYAQLGNLFLRCKGDDGPEQFPSLRVLQLAQILKVFDVHHEAVFHPGLLLAHFFHLIPGPGRRPVPEFPVARTAAPG